MADQDPIIPDNNGGDDGSAPQVATIAQYIKDLSVENPNSPQVFQWQDQPPRLDVQFHINVNAVDNNVHEVALKIEASAKTDKGTHFLVDLSYGGLFGFRNIPEEAMAPFLLAEAPRMLFPFARQIIAEAVQNCGFPPLLLDPIDFGAAYMAQAEAAAAQDPNTIGGGEGQAGDISPPTDEAPSA
jgi:preprotein translocase subunit SecB